MKHPPKKRGNFGTWKGILALTYIYSELLYKKWSLEIYHFPHSHTCMQWTRHYEYALATLAQGVSAACGI